MSTTTEPYVGMLATYKCHTDRYSGRIVAVSRKNEVVLFEHKHHGNQRFFSLRSTGSYLEVGDDNEVFTLLLGVAEDYMDQNALHSTWKVL